MEAAYGHQRSQEPRFACDRRAMDSIWSQPEGRACCFGRRLLPDADGGRSDLGGVDRCVRLLIQRDFYAAISTLRRNRCERAWRVRWGCGRRL